MELADAELAAMRASQGINEEPADHPVYSDCRRWMG